MLSSLLDMFDRMLDGANKVERRLRCGVRNVVELDDSRMK